ncbi:MAG: SPOR domain-containing protein [Rhodocyclaceae bacterium]|nr:SPOR domain-containing protein [Rhodocyclaceae bacterium]MBK9955845.1 SPOR domain-containing protein [Rhodocyclaceae bacterium]
MTEQDTQPPNLPDGDEALRRSLLKRVGVAAVLVVALLAALMLFDGQSGRDEQRVAPVARVEPPVKPIEQPTEPAVVDVVEQADVAAVPEDTETPISRPRADERPLTMPARAQNAAMRPAEPAATPKPDAVRDIARAVPPKEVATMPTASRPIAQATESSRHFQLQMGVFNNLANAEELKTRLEAAGVPAHIEARVQVGPFASRREAEQAREKLKSLGMEPGLIVAARK